MSEENETAVRWSIRQRIWWFTQTFGGIEKSKHANIKTKAGGKIEYSYFTIDDVYNAAVPVMTECGIAATDWIETRCDEHGRYQALVVELSTADGIASYQSDTLRSETTLPSSNDMRAFGSALTYLRRYVLCTMLNIRVPGEDDDAEKSDMDQRRNEVGGVSERAIKKIKDLMEDTDSAESDVLNYIGTNYGLTSFDELSANQASTLTRMLEQKKRGAKK